MKPKGKEVWINSDPYGVEAVWDIKAEVEDVLSAQFTARVKGIKSNQVSNTETMSFLFFNDEGATWKNAGEDHSDA